LTAQILTPADFAKLNELKLAAAEAQVKAGGGSAARRKLLDAKKRAKEASAAADFLSEAEIIGQGSQRVKADYDERMASIQKGREGREKFGSKTAKWKAEKGSSTNEEKRRKKSFQMVRLIPFVVSLYRGLTRNSTDRPLQPSLQQEERILAGEAETSAGSQKEAEETATQVIDVLCARGIGMPVLSAGSVCIKNVPSFIANEIQKGREAFGVSFAPSFASGNVTCLTVLEETEQKMESRLQGKKKGEERGEERKK
jgi:hypothetical protein